MNILISGGLGYLGSFLANNFSDITSNNVVIVDPGLYMPSIEVAMMLKKKNVFHHKNIASRIQKYELSKYGDFDLTIDASGLSNDAVCNELPEFIHRFNVEEPLSFAQLSASLNTKKHIICSSSAIYGFRDATQQCAPQPFMEVDKFSPQTLYANSKVILEERIRELSLDFPVYLLRLGTLFGVSPAHRFDLAVNIMTLHAMTLKRITVLGGGKQFRPFVSLQDVENVIVKLPTNQTGFCSLNVSYPKNNISIGELASIIQAKIETCEIIYAPDDPDIRSYPICSLSMQEQIQQKEPLMNIEKGVEDNVSYIKSRMHLDLHGSIFNRGKTVREVLKFKPLCDNFYDYLIN